MHHMSGERFELNSAKNRAELLCYPQASIPPAEDLPVRESQTEVSALSPCVAFLDHQRSLLTLGNSHLKQRIAALAQDKIFKDGDRHCRHRDSIRAACLRAEDGHDDDGGVPNLVSLPVSDAVLLCVCVQLIRRR
jgi:hypothetical protein